MCADIFLGSTGEMLLSSSSLYFLFSFFPDLCFFMSVGLVAIAAGLRNLLGFSFHVLGSEFSIDMLTLNLLFVYHLSVGFSSSETGVFDLFCFCIAVF